MKSINNVKLGLDPNTMKVIVSATVEMNGEDDPDDLYLVMFNIMDEPLRLSLFTIGDLFKLVKKNTKMADGQILEIMKSNPEKYIGLAIQNIENLGTQGKENVRVVLDNENNAKKARIVLSSMIENQHYIQKSKYLIGNEVVDKEQVVETENLIPQLKMMLEIVKRWDGFDPNSFKEEFESGKIKL